MAILDDQVGGARPGRDGQALLPAVEIVEPGAEALAAPPCVAIVGWVVDDGDPVQVGDVDAVAVPALVRGQPPRPDPAPDGLLRPMGALRCFADGDLLYGAHVIRLLPLLRLLQHKLIQRSCVRLAEVGQPVFCRPAATPLTVSSSSRSRRSRSGSPLRSAVSARSCRCESASTYGSRSATARDSTGRLDSSRSWPVTASTSPRVRSYSSRTAAVRSSRPPSAR